MRLNIRRITLAVALFTLASYANAAELNRAVVSRLPPDYPEIARRIHVQGTVTVEVVVNPEGDVIKARAIAGHPMLLTAAERCVSNWHYMRGKITERGTVTVLFDLTPEP